MSYKDSFTSHQWYTLELGFIWMFQAIAIADGKVDVYEMDAMSKISSKAGILGSDLAKEVAESLVYDVEELSSIYSIDKREFIFGFTEIADILDLAVSRAEANGFKKALIAAGAYVANASGEIFDDKISSEEESALNEIMVHLRISMETINASPSVKSIVQLLTEC